MTTAQQFCQRAADTIQERDPIYGGPGEAGFRIALLWNALLELFPPPLEPADVMRMLLAMKMVRSSTDNDRIDAIGYAACLAEVASELEREQLPSDGPPPSLRQSCKFPDCDCDCDCEAHENERERCYSDCACPSADECVLRGIVS